MKYKFDLKWDIYFESNLVMNFDFFYNNNQMFLTNGEDLK